MQGKRRKKNRKEELCVWEEREKKERGKKIIYH